MKLVDKNASNTPPVHVPDTALQHNGAQRNDNLSASFLLGEKPEVKRQHAVDNVTRYVPATTQDEQQYFYFTWI